MGTFRTHLGPILSSQRMSVLSKDAGLDKGCRSCHRMQVLSKDAGLVVLGENSKTHVSRVQLWRSVLSSHRMQVLSKDAGLVVGCGSCCFGTHFKNTCLSGAIMAKYIV